MTSSMTGFSRRETVTAFGRLTWEIRSVNHRYLDVTFKLPEDIRSLEPELRQQVMTSLARGKVECLLRYSTTADNTHAVVEVDEARLSSLRQALDQIALHIPTQAPDPLDLLRFPGVMKAVDLNQDVFHKVIQDSFNQAVTHFIDSREREGARLRDFLLQRITTISELVEKVRERFPEHQQLWWMRVRQRAAELNVELDPQRLEQELALLLQKMDVEEELSRLGTHLYAIEQALLRNDAVGRRLDFLIQELNREANTLASKSQDSEISSMAVEMKVAIEQMREQVQNIE